MSSLVVSANTDRFATFARSLLGYAIARAFTPAPAIPIWQFADLKVWLQSEDAAEPGPYRSAKTTWTRRIQELPRRRFMWVYDFEKARWTKVPVTEINIKKSTQSGYTEAVLNIIRWIAQFLRRNVIYAIDSLDEAKKIARRLLRSLKLLDPGIFTGDPDDITKSEFLLRGMELLFIGSFSPGKFANKQAWLVVNDEVEDHSQAATGNTSTTRDSFYRGKTHDDGIQINLSKPKLQNGPIDKLHRRGNQEEFFIECPHCQYLQFVTHRAETYDSPFTDKLDVITDPDTGEKVLLPRPLPAGQTRKVTTGRLVYDHCKDLLGNWDEVRILREIYFECAKCKGKIEEEDKNKLAQQAADRDPQMLGWLPTAIGTPGVVSQHINDLLSSDKKSSWGQIILEYLAAKKEGRRELQGVINNRFGNTWREELIKTEETDILSNVAGRDKTETDCPPYKRGTIPFVPAALLLGSDVGGNYARWVLGAVLANLRDCAVIDWGDEIDPETIAEIVMTHTWPCHADGKRHRITQAGIDAKFRKIEVQRICWHVFQNGGHKLIPMAGLGGSATRGLRVWSYTPVQTYKKGPRHSKYCQLNYNDHEAKMHLYIDCLRKKNQHIWFPADLFGKDDKPKDAEAKQFIAELCAEELIEGPGGRPMFNPSPKPNHYGDSLKNLITLLRFLTRKHHLSREAAPQDEAAEIAA